MKEEMISVTTALKFAKLDPAKFQQLETAQKDYQNALSSQGPLLTEVKESFGRINQIYEQAGLSAPFVLDYSVIEDSFKKGQERRAQLEKERDEAHAEYSRTVEYVQKNLGTASIEGQKLIHDAQKKWDDLSTKISEAWQKENKAAEIMSANNKEAFMKESQTVEFLEKLYAQAQEKNRLGESIANRVVGDEMTTIKIKKELSGISFCLESLKEKQQMVKKAIAVKDEISYRFKTEDGINLKLYFDEEVLPEEKKEDKKVEKDLPIEKETEDIKEKASDMIPEVAETELEPKKVEMPEPPVESPVEPQIETSFEPAVEPVGESPLEATVTNSEVKPPKKSLFSWFPSGKHKVKTVRNAKMNSYVKAGLTGAAISGIGITVIATLPFVSPLAVAAGLLPSLPLIGAGLGAVGGVLIRKIIGHSSKMEEIDNIKDDEKKLNKIKETFNDIVNQGVEQLDSNRQEELNAAKDFAEKLQPENIEPELMPFASEDDLTLGPSGLTK